MNQSTGERSGEVGVEKGKEKEKVGELRGEGLHEETSILFFSLGQSHNDHNHVHQYHHVGL